MTASSSGDKSPSSTTENDQNQSKNRHKTVSSFMKDTAIYTRTVDPLRNYVHNLTSNAKKSAPPASSTASMDPSTQKQANPLKQHIKFLNKLKTTYQMAPPFHLILLRMLCTIVLFYNVLIIPYCIAFEREWHIALLITNICLDVLYFVCILFSEGDVISWFILKLMLWRFLKALDRFFCFLCCGECFGLMRNQWRKRQERKRLEKLKKLQQQKPMSLLERTRGILAADTPPSPQQQQTNEDIKNDSHNSEDPDFSSLFKDMELSQQFKDDFLQLWDSHMRLYFKNYLFTYKFLADLVLFVFVDWFFMGTPWVRVGKFFASAIRFSSQFEFVLSALNFRSSTVRVMRLLLLLVLLFHIFACAFFYVSDIPGERWGTGIIPAEPLKMTLLRNVCMSRKLDFKYGSERLKQYNCSLYFAMVYIVGFQDITPPQGFYQACYAVAYALAGSMLFATMVGTVSALVQSRDLTAVMYQEKLENVKGFMRERKVSPWLKRTITRYYELLRKTRRDISVHEVFHDLDLDLYRNISHNLYKDLVMNIDLFRECNNPFFVSDVCQSLEYVLVLNGIDIIHEHDVGQKMYFIHSGNIEVYHSDDAGKETIYATLGPGSLFGEISIVCLDQKRNASCRAKTSIVELFSLSFHRLYAILEKYPDCKSIVYELLKERKNKFEDITKVASLNHLRRKRKSSRAMSSLLSMVSSIKGDDATDLSARKSSSLRKMKASKSQEDIFKSSSGSNLLHTNTQRQRARSVMVPRRPPPVQIPPVPNMEETKERSEELKRQTDTRDSSQNLSRSEDSLMSPNLSINIPSPSNVFPSDTSSSSTPKYLSEEPKHTGQTPLLRRHQDDEDVMEMPDTPPTESRRSTEPSKTTTTTTTTSTPGQGATPGRRRRNSSWSPTTELSSPLFSPSVATIDQDAKERIEELHRMAGMHSSHSPQSMTKKRKVRKVLPVAGSPTSATSPAKHHSVSRASFGSSPTEITVRPSSKREQPPSPLSRQHPTRKTKSSRQKSKKSPHNRRALPPISPSRFSTSPLGGLPPLSSPSRLPSSPLSQQSSSPASTPKSSPPTSPKP